MNKTGKIKKIILLFLLILVLALASCDYAGYPYYLTYKTLNICLVIDHSGSMSGASLADAKAAAKVVVDNLSAENTLSIVIFESQASVLMAPTLVSDKIVIKALIDTISATGGTSVSSGLDAAYYLLNASADLSQHKTVLLLCDGDVDTRSISLASGAFSQGIKTSAVGIGGAQSAVLNNIAFVGHGSFYNLASSAELATTFLAELDSLLAIIDN